MSFCDGCPLVVGLDLVFFVMSVVWIELSMRISNHGSGVIWIRTAHQVLKFAQFVSASVSGLAHLGVCICVRAHFLWTNPTFKSYKLESRNFSRRSLNGCLIFSFKLCMLLPPGPPSDGPAEVMIAYFLFSSARACRGYTESLWCNSNGLEVVGIKRF